MTIKASGRSALILATGLLVCFAGPSQAAATATTTRDCDIEVRGSAGRAKHQTRFAPLEETTRIASPARSRRNPPPTRRPPTPRPTMPTTTTVQSPTIPPSVANANAQTAVRRHAGRQRQGDVRARQRHRCRPRRTIRPTRSRQPTPRSSPPISSTTSIARCSEARRPQRRWRWPRPMRRRAAAPAAAASDSSESSTWDQTSLIGKIFIGFGALLTMASAARMFMA